MTLKPSLHGFLLDLNVRITMIVKGEGIVNKVRLFFWAIFNSTPRTLMKILPLLKNPVEYIKNRLAKEIIVNLAGNKFHCVDSESIKILSYDFEKWMWEYLKLKKGNVFLDIGAHLGKYSIPAAKMVGKNGLVIAVEPHPENYKTLQENIKLNGLDNIRALNIAAWNRRTLLKLFVAKMCGQHSAKKNFGLGFVVVQAFPLDDVLNELKVNKVDYVKIDVEGSEFEVLEGLRETLRKNALQL